MKKMITITALSFILYSCSTETDPESEAHLKEVRQAIAESNRIYFTSFSQNDPAIFTERYAEDACILVPGTSRICGQKACKDFFKTAYDRMGLRNGKFITTAVYGNGKHYATEEGVWQSFDANGKMFDDGKFLVLWKKTNRGWKMYRDSFSSNHSN